MNDLSNKFMTFLCGTDDEYTNNIEEIEPKNINYNPLNQKVFYLF
jgi:hypothetical protein